MMRRWNDQSAKYRGKKSEEMSALKSSEVAQSQCWNLACFPDTENPWPVYTSGLDEA